jgi:hypothetical protein
MESARSPEKLVPINQLTQRHTTGTLNQYNCDRDCTVCMGYNRALVTMRHPASRNKAATTVLLFLTILVMRKPEVSLLAMTPPPDVSLWSEWMTLDFSACGHTVRLKPSSPSV